MEFEAQRIFHIYNRGNNKQTIFFNRENYLFFLKKMQKYVLPYGNLLAWCLMPNHFHFMLEVESINISVFDATSKKEKIQSLNNAIGIMLRSYTRAINKEQNRSGAIFQQKTKAKCLNDPEFSPAYFNTSFGMIGNVNIEGMDYFSTCFHYIHLNPVHHKLVTDPFNWEFSSYNDVSGTRKGKLINRDRLKDLELVKVSL